jgi:hypothetical protein
MDRNLGRPSLEREGPLSESEDVVSTLEEYTRKLRCEPHCLSPQGGDFWVIQDELPERVDEGQAVQEVGATGRKQLREDTKVVQPGRTGAIF